MTRSKKEDEIFCRSCGDPIKREAEVCPECGVRNQKSTSRSRSGGQKSATHDPSMYETNVGEKWWMVIAVTSVLLPIGLGIVPDSPTGVLPAIGGILTILGVVGPMVGYYFDRQYVRANSEWHPSRVWIIAAFLLTFLNFILAIAYLYKRHQVLGEP